MLIASSLVNTEKSLLELEISKDDEPSAILTFKQFLVQETCANIQYMGWVMPGFCLLHENIVTSKGCIFEMGISDEHIVVTVLYQGNMQLLDTSSTKISDLPTNIIKREYSKSTTIRSYIAADEQIQRFFIIFSKPYLLKLLKGENWLKNDPFYRHLLEHTNPVHYITNYFLELPVKHILNDFLYENYDKAFRRTFFELKLKELLFRLHTQPETDKICQHVPDEIYQKLIMAKTYLLANFTSPPTIRQLSRIVILNEFKLKQYFKIVFNSTVHAYIIDLKMEEAKKLILENWSVNDIALKVGYKSVSHFILVFKKHFNYTPKQMLTFNELDNVI